MITPIAQLKKILDKANENLNEFAVALLAANDDRIILKEEILLEYSASGKGSDDNCEFVTYCPFFIEEIVYKDGSILVYQSHNGQALKFDSRFNLVEKENILSKAALCAENPAKTEYWPTIAEIFGFPKKEKSQYNMGSFEAGEYILEEEI